MTPQERKVARQTGKIISSVRKSKGLTQGSIAVQLAVSQSALSKIEHGLLIPSVHQWFEFCKFTGVPVDSHLQGYVDYSRPVVKSTHTQEGAFRLPKTYAVERASTARTMLPLIKWLERNEGEKKAEAVLTEMGMDSDYFIQLDHTIGVQFGLDLIAYLQRRGIYSPEGAQSIFKAVKQRGYHGSLWTGYDQTQEPFELMALLLSRASYYEANFDYVVEAQTKKHLDFSSKPGSHFKEIKTLANHDARFTICSHRRGYFEHMAESSIAQNVVVEEVECAFKGAKKCVFRMRMEAS
jgi:transcriptional regulator with XRE-family HTH domain